ncbi:MAG: transcriptional repressor NrdR, partial [Chloroflexi bacterium]|nr:transcriptional repressor NrdR [Chloroflexota bacterium]
MRCPYCSDRESKVTDSRTNDAGIRRRRECLNCRQRFTTYERVQAAPLMVYKRDGRREEFSREKMIAGLHKACAKRPVTPQAIEQLVDEVESELHRSGNVEADTFLLGSLVMERLPDLDRVAYIRYASVYREFQDIESFERAVRDLRDGSRQLPLLDMPPRPRGRG